MTRLLERAKWLLALPWIASVPPLRVKEELSARLLTMFAGGAPGWLKSSLSVPSAMVVGPV